MGKSTVQYFIIALIISMAFAYLMGWNQNGENHEEEAMRVAAENNQEEELIETEFEGIQLKRWTQDHTSYQIVVNIPMFGIEEIDNFFEEDAEQRVEHFIALIEHNGRVSESHPGVFYLTTDLYQSGEDLFSVVQSEETYTGGANFDQKSYVYLVDLKAEEFVDQSDLFDHPFAAQERFFELVEEGLRESEYYADYILEDELQKWLSQDEYDFSNVFIRNKNLVVKFDKYEVTSGVAGMPEIEVDLDEMKEFMNEEWIERIEAIEETSEEYFL